MSDATLASSGSAAALASGKGAPPELTSILSQVHSLQNDRERLMRELEEAKAKMDKLQVSLAVCGSQSPPALHVLLLTLALFALLVLVMTLAGRRRGKEKR